ncbi:MAG TPA: EAL domain-containing protein, partial [Noviherbaspirillum sp.]
LHVMRDITERKRSAEQLAYLAHYDALTGLPNRALFQQKLEHAINVAERPGRTLELLFLDIDRFKQINDTLGHDAGDAVLKETAHRLRACLRESDTVARLAGDEFVVLVENVKEAQRGATIAEKILAAFSPPFSVAGTTIHVGTSIGIAASPHDAHEPTLLLKHADSAMYRAKQQGRNRYCYYSPQLDAETAVRRTLEHSLRHALERGELALHYQPSFDIASGRMTGMEALLRWTHPQLGVVKPQRFLALAEEKGLMDGIGDWILRQACRQALEWNDDGMRVAVNLSAQQFNDMQLGQRLQAVLAETGLAPDRLEIEIPEEALSGQEEQAQRSLEALHALGVGLTIDHFGFGHASLAQLAASRAGTVKIGPALIRNLPGDASGVALARVIVHVAHSLGWRVVAQGAETRQQVDFLRTLSCDSVQGHYFGEAMPAAVLRERMQDQASLLH